MLLVAIVLKGLLEVLLVVLFGQGVLYLLAGARRQGNPIYRAFTVVTAPIMRATRRITPRFIVDQHIGLVAFFLLAVLWLGALAMKVYFVLQMGGRPPTP